jgi:hypothetical protein
VIRIRPLPVEVRIQSPSSELPQAAKSGTEHVLIVHTARWAVVLHARRVSPIHHGLFHNPPHYAEQDHALERFRAGAQRRSINIVTLRDRDPVPMD